MTVPVSVPHLNCSWWSSCIVNEDGWTTCSKRACPECGSPAVHVTELVGGDVLERGTCECGLVWDTA